MTDRPPSSAPASPKRARKSQPDRRAQILDAALDVFAEQGYVAARLDDIAARAEVGKGTIYLYFKDKQDLFEQIIRAMAEPVLSRAGDISLDPTIGTDEILTRIFALFRSEILGTRRKLVIRLVLAEAPRFPAIAQFYYREIVTRGLAMIRAIAARGIARGELKNEALLNHPQLVFAPLLLSVVWDGAFASLEPLDIEGLFAAHRQVLLGEGAQAEALADKRTSS